MKNNLLIISVLIMVLTSGYPAIAAEAKTKPTKKIALVKKTVPKKKVLATYTTTFNSGMKNRTLNIQLAGKYLTVTLKPGKIFSFNNLVGERTPERGFKKATGFLRGKKVPMYGGGICQLSTTIYISVLKAGIFKVVERHPHTMPVTYAPTGMDAAIDWGTRDLKFKNTKPYPITIQTVVKKGKITVTILGC